MGNGFENDQVFDARKPNRKIVGLIECGAFDGFFLKWQDTKRNIHVDLSGSVL